MMRRTVLPVALLLAVSVIAAGMAISASGGAQDPTNAMTKKPAD